MEKQQISPEKITKPMQLLGAWLVGLLSVDVSFLFAATNIGTSAWQSSALVIAAIVNVPIFIGALFMLQTKFRPELQEDSFYSSYLNSKTNEIVKVPKKDIQLEEIEKRIEALEKRKSTKPTHLQNSKLSSLGYGVNVNLSNQDEIVSKLFEVGVAAVHEFGEKSGALDGMKVAIAEWVGDDLRGEILSLAAELGFEHYSTIYPWEEIDDDVLFGAYGDTDGRITKKNTQ